MPYVRKGLCVYEKNSGKKVGCSKDVATAKRYLKALYMHSNDAKGGRSLTVHK